MEPDQSKEIAAVALHIILKSILHRRLSTCLTILSIALSISLLLTVEKIRNGARLGFTSTISSTDLIVGSKSSPINLLLYSVFHLGNPTENIPWQAYHDIKNHPDIQWTIPLSLGDSHGIYRVVGTDHNFYEHFRYSNQEKIKFKIGRRAHAPLETVIGADVAASSNYKIGDSITLSHGAEAGVSFHNHDEKPFTIVGILQATGTPVDRSLYISLEGMEAIHEGWEDGAPPPKNEHHHHDHHHDHDQERPQSTEVHHKDISAFLLKTKSRIGTLQLQREINQYPKTPLLAIIPGITLAELWNTLGYLEKSLTIISFLVILIGLLSMLISLYNSLNERRREIAILRSLGGSPLFIFTTLILEALILSGMGMLLGLVSTELILALAKPWLIREFSVNLDLPFLTSLELYYLGGIWCFSGLLGFIPAVRAYIGTLSDGLTIKI